LQELVVFRFITQHDKVHRSTVHALGKLMLSNIEIKKNIVIISVVRASLTRGVAFIRTETTNPT